MTTHWALHMFQFIMAVMEVNIFLVMRFFVWSGDEKMTLLEMRTAFSWQLINNSHLVVED